MGHLTLTVLSLFPFLMMRFLSAHVFRLCIIRL